MNETIKLFHGSPSKISAITDEGLFGGIFASCETDTARSHGQILHVIEMSESEILTHHQLNYDADYQAVAQIIRKNTSEIDDCEFDAVWNVIVEEKSLFSADLDENRALEIFRGADLAEASWEAQRIRGLIAASLGYKAVETYDEHGISYLVLPGATIRAL